MGGVQGRGASVSDAPGVGRDECGGVGDPLRGARSLVANAFWFFFAAVLLTGCLALPPPQAPPTPTPQPAPGQPKAPELSLNGGTPVPGARFEFGKLPELVLIRGIPQVVQLGFYQIDPANPWPAGDVERASGWLSNYPTRLVDATTGAPVTLLQYEERTGELTFGGNWSGDLTVRLQQLGGSAQSNAFRIRVLTPTVVYGENAHSIAQQHAWNSRICPSETMSFAQCRQKFIGGISDIAPLVVFITPGSYRGQDWYLALKRFTYVLGDPNTRPTLFGDNLSGSKKEMFYVANLNMNDTNIAHSGPLPGAPNTMIIRSVYQCCEIADHNGIVNPNSVTNDYLWSVYWHASESKGMGGVGNTTHPAYVEGRPTSLFDVNNVRILGSRGSSGVKTTMNELNVRHSLLQVAQTLGEINNGTCVPRGASSGCLMHTPIDFPGFTAATIYANKFIVWRGTTMGVTAGRSGVLAGTIFIRQRGPSLGSDTPNYPNVSWNPPVSKQGARMQGFCKDWPPIAATFVADDFWKDVRASALADPANACTFKHYVSFNQFEQVAGSLPVIALRDDGTYPAEAMSQFSPYVRIKRNHALWAERSTSFLYSNTYVGFDANPRKYRLDNEPNVREIEPLAFWPRSGPDDFPRVVDDLGKELPPWFKL